MIIQLKSALHTEDISNQLSAITNPHFSTTLTQNSQVIHVMTGGTEGLFLEKVKAGEIDIKRPMYLVASGQSNSLAASLEILSYINQHGGKGEIVES